MKLLLAAGLLSTVLASVGGAVAMQWKTDLGRVLVAPGAIAPTFETPCAKAAAEAAPRLDEDCSLDAMAEWLADWFESLGRDGLEQVLLEGDPDGELGVTAAELLELDHEGLVDLLSSLSDQTLAELCDLKADAKPCKVDHFFGYCESGGKCTTATCATADGTVKSCFTRNNPVKNTLAYASCPQATWTYWYCEDQCPIPAWALLLGAVGASGVFALRRKLFPL